MTGFVYAISDGHGRVKLGWSADPERRLIKAQSDNGAECDLLGVVGATREQERNLHRLLKPWRIRGEWFEERAAPVAGFISFLDPVHIVRKRLEPKQRLVEEIAESLGASRAAVFKWRERGVPSAWQIRIVEASNKLLTFADIEALRPFREEISPSAALPQASESQTSEDVTGEAA